MLKIGKEMLFLSENDVKDCISTREAVELAELGVSKDGDGLVAGDKYYMDFGPGFMKPFSGYIQGQKQAFAKVFTLFPDNPEKYGISTTCSLVVLFDSETGMPVCFMEAKWITGLKTGASTAVTIKHLKKDSDRVVAIIGAGLQGVTHLEALNEVMDMTEIRIYDKFLEKSESFARDLGSKYGLNIIPKNSPKEAIEGADIVVTITTGKEIMVRKEWLKPGALVARMGTFYEIDPELLLQADKLIVDRWSYTAQRVAEVRELIDKKRLSREDVHAEWPEIISGKKPGRESDEEFILYTGLGIWGEYAAILPRVFENAMSKKIGKIMEIDQA